MTSLYRCIVPGATSIVAIADACATERRRPSEPNDAAQQRAGITTEMAQQPLPPAFFEKLYERDDDPWSFATSAYESAKYDASIAALEPRYAAALEVGCSVGVLTRRLAERCDALLAVDVSERALATAAARCSDVPHVRFERRVLPREFPDGPFDLIVISEVAYYWSNDDVALAVERSAATLRPGGDLLLVHFRPKVDGHVNGGDDVHARFLAEPRFTRVRGHRADRYRLDVLRRR
ncbi:MAG TPA: class I SAM-dependent methyltransferase [Candidatus Baltobacteraceae bacterium]|nr:class I SAM-dependent methyltransferase [Candidatus Baltobacteraceae bacterium]